MRLQYIRIYSRSLSVFILTLFITSLIPVNAWAITSGPAQEEYAGFKPAQTTQLVNPYSGDFSYNIPLMNVPGPNGGYPINLFYNSGSNVNEAGSWVGLGWNLNIGAVNRQMRGLPDDFNGEEVKQEMHLKRSFSVGLNVPPLFYKEKFGFPDNKAQFFGKSHFHLYYNNYKGLGYKLNNSLGVSFSGFNAGVGLSLDSQNGISVDPSVGLTLSSKHGLVSAGATLTTSYNSRRGLQALTLATQLKASAATVIAAGSLGSNSSMTFGFNTTVPTVMIPTKTTSINFDIKIGATTGLGRFNVPPIGNWVGNVEWSKVIDNGLDIRPAYGYLHNENDSNNEGLKDFNRVSQPYNRKVPNLPTSAFTYDPLFVSGQGIAGTFRPYRSQVEVLSSPTQESKVDGFRANLEFGLGTGIHIGAGYAHTEGSSYSGVWQDGIDERIANPAAVPGGNFGYNVVGDDYQAYYYQLYGEQVAREETSAANDQLEAWNDADPLRAVLDKSTGEYETNGTYADEKTSSTLNPGSLPSNEQALYAAREKRTNKANSIQTLNARQASSFGFTRKQAVAANEYGYYQYGTTTKTPLFGSNIDQSDQISEIIVTKNDGMRYAYGLPAINTKQVDAIFNVYPPYKDPFTNASVAGNSTTDLIKASGHTTNRASNQYESKTTLPGYAHSWLLTHIVSPDYADRLGDGFSPDDPGSWMKFEYQRVTSDQNRFKWREPYIGASFMEGNKGAKADDMAAYSYGEKDLYYLYKIESPSHVAYFEVDARDDAIGVSDEGNGGRDLSSSNDNNRMYRLKTIKLYTKVNGSVPAGAQPLQTVTLGHDYSLCQGIPSNSNTATGTKGKLTLKDVTINTDYSIKGSMKYTFGYSTNNPDFNRRNRDRWGNFQDHSGMYESQPTSSSDYPYTDFPYTDQYAPPIADAWQLTQITLPTGGMINVEYESDDYAYEMDKPAAQMFDIVGVGNAPADPLNVPDRKKSGALVEGDLSIRDGESYRIYVSLPNSLPGNTTALQAEYFRSYYLKDLDYVYFKNFTKLKDKNAQQFKDYVAGYAEVVQGPTNSGVVNSNLAFFKVKSVPIQKTSFGQTIHPFQRAALEHLQVNRSELVYDTFKTSEPTSKKILKQIAGVLGSFINLLNDVFVMMNGFNRVGVDRNWGEKIVLNGRSVVRLNAGSGFMYGGGNRVRTIQLDNDWAQGAGNDIYGQSYDYTIVEDGRTISSGVAITPQNVGGDESALLQPVFYKNSTPLASSQNLFIEKPIMKGYYPGASVGYRKVTVRSLAEDVAISSANSNDDPNLALGDYNKALAPVTEYEYYTHKDFPVIESETELSAQTPIMDMTLFPLIGSRVIKRIGRSQGYTIELNNMAGMEKATTQKTYSMPGEEDGTVIRQTRYLYHTEAEYDPDKPNRLSSQVRIMTSPNDLQTGTLSDGVIGETYDIFHDFHENATSSNQKGGDFNLEIKLPFIFIPTFIPVKNVSETSIRTAVTHKVVYRTGILKEVEVTDGLSTISTENIAFDPATAQPILTRTYNEFEDPIYAFAQPAYWYYDNPNDTDDHSSMAGAYQNLGITTEVTTPVTSGQVNLNATQIAYFVEGDELWAYNENTDGTPFDQRWWVTGVNTTNNTLSCIDENGNTVDYNEPTFPLKLMIARSGHRNLLTTSAGSIAFKGQPASTTNPPSNLTDFHFAAINDQVLNTAAATFKDDWKARQCSDYWEYGESCSLNVPLATDLLALLNAIADPNVGNADLLTTTELDLSASSAYAPFLTTSITGFFLGTAPYFYGFERVAPGNVLEFYLRGTNPEGGWRCSFSLDPNTAPLTWSTVTGFANINHTNIDNTSFTVTAITTNGFVNLDGTQSLNRDGGEGCYPIRICTITDQREICDEEDEATDNPYLIGERGMWRPHKSFAYKADREYHDDVADAGNTRYMDEPRIRDYGTFTNGSSSGFNPFDWNPLNMNANLSNGWVMASEVTLYSPQGNVLEERDALGNFSAAQYGYNKQLAVGVANNAQLRDIGVDGFEDYDKNCTDHFRFSGGELTRHDSHTGLYSLRLTGGESASMFKTLTPNSDCISNFQPEPSGTYIVSAWVKIKDFETELPNEYNYAGARLEVLSGASAGAVNTNHISLRASGPIIDGWQRMFGQFTIGNTATAQFLMIELINGYEGNFTTYFDDVRVHPIESSMQSFVYNPDNLRLMATLDENNYATFLIRDQEGQVVKYNVETEKGIVTLNEGTRHIVSQ